MARGIAVAIMALDHVREYFGTGDPLDLAEASLGMFATRWITHICAPMFCLLTGISAYIRCREHGQSETASYLRTRGALLVLIELTVMRCLAYQFNFDYQTTGLLALWALGCSMLVLSVALCKSWQIALVGGLTFCAIGTLSTALSVNSGDWLLEPSVHSFGDRTLLVAYPPIPWAGIALIGLAAGPLYYQSRRFRYRWMTAAFILSLVAFIAVRSLTAWDSSPAWLPGQVTLSFLNVSKYPPSIAFTAMTLSICFVVLILVDKCERVPILTLYGRSALFFYVVHFALIHALATLLVKVKYGEAFWMISSPTLVNYPFTRPPSWGETLPTIYLIWFLVLILMIPLCEMYYRGKARELRVLKYI